ncbi:flagellar hook-length control protein [mine drainage metagenome]|uniref:Flagellar hook-length control protein n=1 Tax=mine drainage metagenome TaxID=410659 RepID=A0A1J5SJ71_9ZZZZ
MTNLPITTSTPQAATASTQTPNAAASGDAQNNQPFGEVLARQINDPAAKDGKSTDKAGTESLLKQGADLVINKKNAADIQNGKPDSNKKATAATAPDGATAVPADMLAALMPQAINTPAASNARPDGSAGTSQDSLGLAALKSNAATNVRADTANSAPAANRSAQLKEQTFSAALNESASRAPGILESNMTERAAINASAAPKSDAGAIASLQNTAASVAAPAIQPVQITINAPVTQDKWSDEFSQKITWLASSSKDQTAELHLNPPQLGPLDVVIKVSGDQATALFTSPHAAVRDAIEQAMPKLREMMADNGIMLGNATVSDQTPRDQGQSGAQRSSVSPIGDIRNIPISSGNSTVRVSPISRHNGIVDTFA